jgi:hypothetical protein
MHKLTLRLLSASLCFLTGLAASYTYPAHPHQSLVPEPRASVSPDSTLIQEWEVQPHRGEVVGLDGKILSRISHSVSRERGGLRFAPAACTCPGIISGQKSHLYGLLSRGDEFVADVYIAEAASTKAAALALAAQKGERDGWQAYALGDEAYLWRSKGGLSSGIRFRIRNLVVQVSGDSAGAELLAKSVAEAVAAS